MSRFLLPAEYVNLYGTQGGPWPLSESCAYTRWLARFHYENFHVATFLLPRRLHQDFYNVYAFCRWADDLGDEIGDPQRSLELLEWWRWELAEVYAGRARHPVFVALRQTVAKHLVPEQPFADLIRAFVQDQHCTRYETYEELLNYCAYSANPVGRLVLHLCGCTDPARIRLSDFTCTALQLANFWQDVRHDWEMGRVYIPCDVMARHNYSPRALEEDLRRGAAGSDFRAVLRELVESTEEMFHKGLPLRDIVDRRLAVDIDLFSRGGMAILDRVRRQDYDVIRRRPRLGKIARFSLLARAFGRCILGRAGLQPVQRRHAA